MSDQPEAMRLADELEMWTLGEPAAAELRRLHADAEESEALRERLSALLRNTAIALRGPEPELTRWSWHDLPELATALKAQRDALLEALKEYGWHHEGCPQYPTYTHPDRWPACTCGFDDAIKAVEENT